ncbi:MAG: hypothetical protein AAB415_02520 [Patescibacteria group bacterium]
MATKMKVKRLSAKLGLKEQAVVDRAVSLLWEKDWSQVSLNRETDQWEKLSDDVWRQIKD